MKDSNEPADIEPGIYPRGSVDYGAIRAVNQSTLKKMGRSALCYHYALEQGWAETSSQFRGTIGHTAILEPMQFMREYVIWEGGDRRGKKWKKFQEDHPDKRIIKPAEYDEAVAKRDAVLAHPVAAPLLQGSTQVEVTIVWDDPETGLRCKGRFDLLRTEDGTVVDLKMTRNAEPFWFGRDAHKFGYHWQSAFYSDGLQVLTGKLPPFKFLVVEQDPPHEVVVFDVPDEVIDLGREEYRAALCKVAECRKSNQWPGIAADGPVTLNLPPWAFSDDDNVAGLGLEF